MKFKKRVGIRKNGEPLLDGQKVQKRYLPIFPKRVNGNLQGQTNLGFCGSTASVHVEKETREVLATVQINDLKQIIEKQNVLIDDKNKDIEILRSIKEENTELNSELSRCRFENDDLKRLIHGQYKELFVERQQNAVISQENKVLARSAAKVLEEYKTSTMKSFEQIQTLESFVIKLQEENRALKCSKGKLQSKTNRLKQKMSVLAKEKENVVVKAKCVQVGSHNKIIMSMKRSNPSSKTSDTTSTSCTHRKRPRKSRHTIASVGPKCDIRTATWATSATDVMLSDQAQMREMEHKQVEEFRQKRRYHIDKKKLNVVTDRDPSIKRIEKPSIGVVYEAIRDWTSTCKSQGQQILCPTAVSASFQKLVMALRALCGDRPDNLLNHLSMSPTDIPPGLQGGDNATIFCHTLQVWLVKQIVDESVPTAPPVKFMEILKSL